jgi:apolipoprotein N-acyltransferase
VSSRSGLFVEWADKKTVALLGTRTFFVRGGYLFAPICAAAAVMLIILSVIAGKKQADPMRQAG